MPTAFGDKQRLRLAELGSVATDGEDDDTLVASSPTLLEAPITKDKIRGICAYWIVQANQRVACRKLRMFPVYFRVLK